jgi:hypothetical protein
MNLVLYNWKRQNNNLMARTNKNITNDSKSHAFDVKKEPLVKIEPDHVVPDELHLLLRICDKLLTNLI